jgi:hypothetical protein
MQATITHKGRSESVTFDILTESGEPQFSVDYGKPELNIYEHGELQPRFNDTRSGLENYTLVAQLVGSSAYADAIKLADLIKSRTGPGEELTIQVSGNGLTSAYPIDETIVAPAAEQERALELTYAPGRVNVVDVQLSLTRVNAVRGGANQDASTPTDTGSGPLKLTDGANPVTMSEDIAITRTVGRPNSTIRSSPRFDPNYIDHRKTAFDGFDIAFQLLENGPNKAETIARSLIKPPLGRDSLTLDFQGLFNMGQFNVIPDGSQAFRVQRIAGRKNVENAPTLNLRRVIA